MNRLREHQKQNKSEGKVKIMVIAIVAALILLSAAQIFWAARVATTGEEIRRLEQQQAKLTLRTQRLGAQINEVSTLFYIEKRARDDLGMIGAIGNVAYLEMPILESYASR